MTHFEKIISKTIHGDEVTECEDMLERGEITETQMIEFQKVHINQMKEYASDLETENVIKIMNLQKDIALLRAENKRLKS